MKRIIQSIIITLLISGAVMSCTKNSPGADSSSNPGGNTIKGSIYDAKGNKFKIDNANVLVHILSANTQNNNVYHVGMDSSGHYEQKVAAGMYTFNARAWMSLNGKVVSVPLDPDDGKAAST